MPKNEMVMVFERRILDEVGLFSGFRRDGSLYYREVIEKNNYSFMSRALAEEDKNYKQVIPYIVICCNDKYLSYQRGKLLSEKRLLQKYSIGFGGHVRYDDSALIQDYTFGLKRELFEELKFDRVNGGQLFGVINDDSDDVGKVHFGFVHRFDVASEEVFSNEKSINKIKFYEKEYLVENMSLYENWSQFLIERL